MFIDRAQSARRPALGRIVRLAFACTMVSWVDGCIKYTPLEPLPPIPVIHAVLNASFDTQFVSVAGTRGILSAASVWIEGKGPPVMLSREYVKQYNGDSVPGPYMLLPGQLPEGIEPGEEYRLLVDLSNGERVESRTRVPVAQVAATVDTGTFVFGDSLRVEFPALSGTRTYYLTVAQHDANVLGQSSSTVFIARFVNGAVTLRPEELTLERSSFTVTSDLFVTVSVVDEHFAHYYSVRSDPISGTAPYSQFTNAQGVFGSVVPIARKRLTVKSRR